MTVEERLAEAIKLVEEWVWVWSDGDPENTGWSHCRLCDRGDWQEHKDGCDFRKILARLNDSR